ncbi:MAG: amidohydrolase family protein [Xanthobacteraceae bacterium]
MRLDAYTHFLPQRFFKEILSTGDHRDIGKRVREIPSIHDLDVRRKVIDSFPDYAQIISYPQPPFEGMAGPEKADEYSRMVNDGFAELCAKHPDHFPGFVAQVSLAAPDAGVAEAERATKDLGALGVQIYTNVRGKPLDRPEFEPFFAAMNKLGTPIWVHPARGANHPDYLDEKKSLYEIWWTFGWSYETAAAMARLVFSKTLDKYPDLKIMVHHFGGIVPMLEGRIGPGWDQLGARTSDEDYESLLKSMKKRPVDYFRMFYADTSVNGAPSAIRCGLDFYGSKHVLFGTDCPFDPQGGPLFIRETIKALDGMKLKPEDRRKIYFGNALGMLRLKPPAAAKRRAGARKPAGKKR